MKKMFVVMEVKNHPSNNQWVIPSDVDDNSVIWQPPALKKSNVIYAQRMEVFNDYGAIPGQKVFVFSGVSSTPELSARERWIEECPIEGTSREHREHIKDWLRHYPKE